MSLTEILRNAFRVEPWTLSGPDWLDEMRSIFRRRSPLA
jgi:hypothetical protein